MLAQAGGFQFIACRESVFFGFAPNSKAGTGWRTDLDTLVLDVLIEAPAVLDNHIPAGYPVGKGVVHRPEGVNGLIAVTGFSRVSRFGDR